MQSAQCCPALRVAIFNGDIAPEEMVHLSLGDLTTKAKGSIAKLSTLKADNGWLADQLNEAIKATKPSMPQLIGKHASVDGIASADTNQQGVTGSLPQPPAETGPPEAKAPAAGEMDEDMDIED